jgi:16S rRNA (cytidine1402-2'-O)-methyltransferase
LPKTEPKLFRLIEEAKQIESTLVAYESPQRIIKTVNAIAKQFPDSNIVVSRELTKMHEEFIRGAALDVVEALSKRQSIKGEITILISFK